MTEEKEEKLRMYIEKVTGQIIRKKTYASRKPNWMSVQLTKKERRGLSFTECQNLQKEKYLRAKGEIE